MYKLNVKSYFDNYGNLNIDWVLDDIREKFGLIISLFWSIYKWNVKIFEIFFNVFKKNMGSGWNKLGKMLIIVEV